MMTGKSGGRQNKLVQRFRIGSHVQIHAAVSLAHHEIQRQLILGINTGFSSNGLNGLAPVLGHKTSRQRLVPL